MKFYKGKVACYLLSALIILLVCAGCSEVTPQQLRNAENICVEKGGVRLITAHVFKKNVAHCGDDTASFIEE